MKDLIILGTGHTREKCPYDSEVWGVNGAYSERVKRKDGIFRMDKLFLTDVLWTASGIIHLISRI